MGGEVLPSLHYELATHIIPMGGIEGAAIVWELDGKHVYSKEWLDSFYTQPKGLEAVALKNTGFNTLSNLKTPCKCGEIIYKQSQAASAASSSSKVLYSGNKRGVKRKIDFDSDHGKGTSFDELRFRNHSIFQCPCDRSVQSTLSEYADKNRENFISSVPIPGDTTGTLFVLISNGIKIKLRRAFRLLLNMHRANLSLRGQFSAENFFFDDLDDVRLGDLVKLNLKFGIDTHDKNKDYTKFVHMVRKEVFRGKAIPTDLSEWLCLSSGVQGCEYLLVYHSSLMESRHSASTFMSLHDIFLEMKTSDQAAYRRVLSELSKHKGWQAKIWDNTHLTTTLQYRDSNGCLTRYNDDVEDLLRLLRNCRRHAALFLEGTFHMIVGQHFPTLMVDFQKAMFGAGRLEHLNLEATMR
uniref:Uncharacterized protein n=1 Tax=Oryza brachyantha TaxID=4533 RepID=J3MPD6_ORYBR